MTLSLVRYLTLAYLKGSASADDVVKAVQQKRSKAPSSEEALAATSNDDEMPTTREPNTWADVGRYFGLMTPKQWDELLQARKRILGY